MAIIVTVGVPDLQTQLVLGPSPERARGDGGPAISPAPVARRRSTAVRRAGWRAVAASRARRAGRAARPATGAPGAARAGEGVERTVEVNLDLGAVSLGHRRLEALPA